MLGRENGPSGARNHYNQSEASYCCSKAHFYQQRLGELQGEAIGNSTMVYPLTVIDWKKQCTVQMREYTYMDLQI